MGFHKLKKDFEIFGLWIEIRFLSNAEFDNFRRTAESRDMEDRLVIEALGVESGGGREQFLQMSNVIASSSLKNSRNLGEWEEEDDS